MGKKKIRVLALGLIRDGNRLFLSQGYDAITQKTFYRAWGRCRLGETSLEALKREFREEIAAELKDIEYLGCLENIFTYQGEPKHEIIQLYKANFVEEKFYQLSQLNFQEGKRTKTALWLDLATCLSGELLILPPDFLKYL